MVHNRLLIAAGLALAAACFNAQALSAVNPLTVTDQLVLRLESNVGVTTDTSGNVTVWADQSGLNHHAVAGGIGPTWLENQLNGNGLLSFNGSNSALFITGTPLLTSQQFSIFVVLDDQRTDSSFREVLSNWTPGNSINSVFVGTTGDPASPKVRFTDNFGGATDPVRTQTGVGTITDPAQPFILSAINALSTASVFQNGSLIAQSNAALTTRDLTSPFYIGKQGTFPGGEYWQGDIAAILLYNKSLSASEQSQVVSYLNSEYLTSPVPVPAAAWLFGPSLIWLLGFGRRKASH